MAAAAKNCLDTDMPERGFEIASYLTVVCESETCDPAPCLPLCACLTNDQSLSQYLGDNVSQLCCVRLQALGRISAPTTPSKSNWASPWTVAQAVSANGRGSPGTTTPACWQVTLASSNTCGTEPFSDGADHQRHPRKVRRVAVPGRSREAIQPAVDFPLDTALVRSPLLAARLAD